MTFIPGGGSGSISSSSDVALNNPANQEVLSFDSSIQKWKNTNTGPNPTELGMPSNPITDSNAARPAWASPAGVICYFKTAVDPVNWRDGDINYEIGA